jgi:hypothetical protein
VYVLCNILYSSHNGFKIQIAWRMLFPNTSQFTVIFQRIFPVASVSRPAIRPTQPIQWVPGGVLSQGKAQPGHETDHLPPSSAELKSE